MIISGLIELLIESIIIIYHLLVQIKDGIILEISSTCACLTWTTVVSLENSSKRSTKIISFTKRSIVPNIIKSVNAHSSDVVNPKHASLQCLLELKLIALLSALKDILVKLFAQLGRDMSIIILAIWMINPVVAAHIIRVAASVEVLMIAFVVNIICAAISINLGLELIAYLLLHARPL